MKSRVVPLALALAIDAAVGAGATNGYHDYRVSISVAPGMNQTVTLNPWVCSSGGVDTCTAWITYPADENHSNDTDVVIVHANGLSAWMTGNPTAPSVMPVTTLDVAVQVVSPRDTEVPGLVPVMVKLTNIGDTSALVDRVDVAIGVPDGVSELAGMEPSAATSMTLSPSPLAGNILHVAYSLHEAGPASVTIFDISGRPAATRRFAADRAGELPMDLRRLSGGVYIVRLNDGRSAVTQKLVVQR